jgi:hypothetical protein
MRQNSRLYQGADSNQSDCHSDSRLWPRATSQNLHCYVPYAYESTPGISAGFPITAQSFSCSATLNACNFSGCHHDPSQCIVLMAGLKTCCCRKRTPEHVKLLKLDKERLQARVAELEARLASHAVTKIDSDKIALLESELSLQAQRTKDAITTTRQLESRAEAETARANKAEAKVSGLRKAAEAMRKTAARALQSSAKRVSVSRTGTVSPCTR